MINRHTKKFTKRFMGSYKVKSIMSNNVVELELPSTVRIHLVVNISHIQRYKLQVKEQRKEIP